MKTAGKYFVASLAMASACALADVPPYHAEDVIAGTATFSVTGSCSVAPQSHAGALFGVVFDSVNDYVGTGIITHDGQLLALVAETGPRTASTYYREDAGDGELTVGGFVNVAAETLYGYMEQNGCPAATLIPLARSRYVFSAGPAGDHLSVDAAFVGYPATDQKCSANGDVTVCRSRHFSGRLTFEGSR